MVGAIRFHEYSQFHVADEVVGLSSVYARALAIFEGHFLARV